MPPATITYQDVLGKQLSAATKKNYESSIRQMQLKMTVEETEEFLDPRGSLIKPLNHEVGARILHECQLREEETETGPVFVLKSHNTAVLYCSAIKYWHKESSRLRDMATVEPIVVSHDLESHLASYTRGRRRLTADGRAAGVESEIEGKFPIDLGEFKAIARRALASGVMPKNARLFHAYLVLCWNLIARSSAVAELLWNNVGWHGDCVTILYEKGKTNQEGMNKVPWHVYANPVDPLICPVLALGLKLVTETDTFGNRPFKVFPAATSDDTFSDWMRVTVDGLAVDPDVLLSIPPNRISTHSLRKGAATYVDGQCDGPNTDSIKLRMEHKLGGCDYRYIFRGAGNDMYVGRSVSGLNVSSSEMGLLPPHFKSPVNVAAIISDAIVSRANNSLKKAFPFLVASVVHHWDWLKENLPRRHPFFTSRIWTSGVYERWKNSVITGIYECTETSMIASGLPKIMINLLETRLVRDAIKDLPEKCSEAVIEKIGRAQDIYLHSDAVLNRTIGPRLQGLERSIEAIVQASGHSLVQNQTPVLAGQATTQFRTFFWNDNWHAYPQDFQIPADTCLKVWSLWLFGDVNAVNTPYRCLDGASMTAAGKIRLTRARKVFDKIRETIGFSYESLTALGPVEAEKKFIPAFTQLFGHIKNYTNMQLSNAYKHDLKARKPTKRQINRRI